MLCYATLLNATLYYAMLCYAILHYAMLCSLAVAMFAPVIILDIEMMSLAFGVALCALLLLEWARLFCRRHALLDAASAFFEAFIDARDACRGMAVTHLYLLAGCALPVWVALAMSVSVSVSVSAAPDSTAGDATAGDGAAAAAGSLCAGGGGGAVDALLPHLGWIVVGIGDSFVRY
jgi:hypothetical protein